MRHVGPRAEGTISSRALCDAVSRPHESCRARECAVEVLVRRQTAHPFIHSDQKSAVNRLPPRGSPSRHGALLAHESTVDLSHSSSHGANRHSCHAEKSISIVRRDATWHSLAVGRARHSAVGVSSLLCRCRSASAVRLPRRQRRRNERRDLRAGLHRTFEYTYTAAPDRLAALRKPAMSHGTPLPWGPFSPPLYRSTA